MLIPDQIQKSIPIQFNTKEIQESLQKTGIYQKDSFTIKIWLDADEYSEDNTKIPEDEDLMFVIQNKDKKSAFLGVVNYYFKREGYCLNTYLNGDIYYGYYSSDSRNRQGIYSYMPKKINEKEMLYQFYYGTWKNDLFNGNGIYLWLREKNSNNNIFNDFDNSKFQAFIGNSIKGIFNKGALISKEKNKYFVYYGSLSTQGKKEGTNCFYYSANLENLCFGTFKNNIFVDGYVGKFNNNGELIDIIKFKKNNIKNEVEKIIFDNKDKIYENLSKIRNVLLSKDYFGILYEVFVEIIKFRNEKMNDMEIILSDKYVQVMKSLSTFNNVTLCKDIEQYLDL
jgi:hypothetical protein